MKKASLFSVAVALFVMGAPASADIVKNKKAKEATLRLPDYGIELTLPSRWKIAEKHITKKARILLAVAQDKKNRANIRLFARKAKQGQSIQGVDAHEAYS